MITPPVPNEEWRPIRDTGYEVSSLGRVRHGERIIKGWIETNGYASAKASDYTAKQFLAHSGLCVSSHKQASKVSECNRILAERGLLLISPLRDENKHRRNLYCYVG